MGGVVRGPCVLCAEVWQRGLGKSCRGLYAVNGGGCIAATQGRDARAPVSFMAEELRQVLCLHLLDRGSVRLTQ
jgi:hypothetical protein